jgi:hypothetical protein
MRRVVTLAFATALLAACADAPSPTMGTEECAEASATCPAGCPAILASALDRTGTCTTTQVAVCSRGSLGGLFVEVCCVRMRDERIFWLSGSMRCPQEPAYVGWRSCTVDEGNALESGSARCP